MSTFLNLDAPIDQIRKIGPTYIGRLHKLGIRTIRDLFYHFPHRYEDFSKIIPIADLKMNEAATIQGQVLKIKNIYTWHKKIGLTEAIIKDESGTIKAIWFNQPYLAETLTQNSLVNLSGKIISDKHGLHLSNPIHEKISGNKCAKINFVHTGRLVPVYPETEGLTSRWLRYIIYPLLPYLSEIKDFLPYEIKKSQKISDIGYALKQIHFPDSQESAQRARQRLSFDELFLIQLSALKQKNDWQKNSAAKIPFNQKIVSNFTSALPFVLTNAQKKAAWEIIKDLEQSKPMNRLLEGDVGSGKTIVAAIAALQVCSARPNDQTSSFGQARLQTVLMAPTEILAQQHFNTLAPLLEKFDICLGLLTGNSAKIYPSTKNFGGRVQPFQGFTADNADYLLEQVKNNKINFLIGTHSLIQNRVKFKNLALAIVDEQHRFGVGQRAALQQKIIKMPDGRAQTIPHLLSMTATPIPRTLALTIYGDLDISLLDEMPAGRQKIITKIVKPQDRQKTYDFIRQQIQKGKQIFVICPRIEPPSNSINDSKFSASKEKNSSALPLPKFESLWPELERGRNNMDIKAVKEEYKKLSEKIFPDLKIGMLHGKLKPKEKENIIRNFANREIDILVSTSVIEVGIDMPNATVIMIEGAEKFGLAQLHQFRGRIGRGQDQSYCFVFTESADKINSSRLRALLTSKNGFELAEKDLEIRGPGEFYGTRQWGVPDLVLASLTDMKLVQSVRQKAIWLINSDPELKKYPALKEKLREFKIIKHFE